MSHQHRIESVFIRASEDLQWEGSGSAFGCWFGLWLWDLEGSQSRTWIGKSSYHECWMSLTSTHISVGFRKSFSAISAKTWETIGWRFKNTPIHTQAMVRLGSSFWKSRSRVGRLENWFHIQCFSPKARKWPEGQGNWSSNPQKIQLEAIST